MNNFLKYHSNNSNSIIITVSKYSYFLKTENIFKYYKIIVFQLVNCFLFPKRMANRTLTLYNSDFLMNNITTGVKLSKVGNDLKFLWTEEFNNKNNSFKVST